jgi:hypothetical protein
MPDLDLIKQEEQASARPARRRSPKSPTIEDAVKAGGSLAGRPEDVIEALKAVERRYPGLDRGICATPLGTRLKVQLEDLGRFAAVEIGKQAEPVKGRLRSMRVPHRRLYEKKPL